MITETSITDRIAAFERACQRTGVKVTHQRLEVLREVLQSKTHPSAEAILEGVKVRLPTVSLDTVYRTLWLLTELGLIATLGPRRDAIRFDANLNPHHHFVCMRCGAAIDVESFDLSRLNIAERLKGLGSVVSAQLEVRGICANCADLSEGKPAE
jgi:Fur family peroxide stress response transcriptional regulator